MTFSNLKEVIIAHFVGGKHQIQLIKLLLAKSLVLERIFIGLLWLGDYECDFHTIQMRTEVEKYYQVSPKARISTFRVVKSQWSFSFSVQVRIIFSKM